MFNNNFGNHNQQGNIVFIRNAEYGIGQPRQFGVVSKKKPSAANAKDKIGFKVICLLDKMDFIKLFQKMPKIFTITTNTGSFNFNMEMLLNTSSTISDFFNDNPQKYQYHIDVDDTENVLAKIKQMYEGETVVFDEDELPISHKIAKILNLRCFPNFLKPESLKGNESSMYNNFTDSLAARLKIPEFLQYLKITAPCSFTITTNKHEYKCKIFGILSSSVLSEIITKDPTAMHYSYDFDDEFDEFKNICDFFNFKEVTFTTENMNSIKEIAEDLQIPCLLSDVEKYINDRENFSKTIDEQQAIVDTIDELFDMLYNIKEITIQTVTKNIINSKWSQTEDKVHELASFIVQVIKTDFLLHPYMFDLLHQIDKDSNESSQLKNLLPFIISVLTYSAFGNLSKSMPGINTKPFYRSQKITPEDNNAIYAFIYILFRNEMISKEEIKEYLTDYNFDVGGINMWFLPELIEIHTLDIYQSKISNNYLKNPKCRDLILSYLPDKINIYKEMRDKREPTDLLTKALREDDVDTLQSIVSKNQIDFTKAFVPFNMFENFIDNGNTRYINYAAAYGSLKCFKFLLLNHDSLDNLTFPYAVFGGNIEIIKIVHQNKSEENDDDVPVLIPSNDIHQQKTGNNNTFTDKLIPAIMKHNNNLFDWIFEQIIFNKNENKSLFLSYFESSVKNGNAHSLIEIIEKGANFEDDQVIMIKNCLCAAENGFYMITKLLFDFLANTIDTNYINDSNPTVYFGNLSIFKLFMKIMDQNQLENALIFAVKRNYMNIVSYFFDSIKRNEEFHFTMSTIFSFGLLSGSIKNKTNDMFNYLFNQIKILDPSFFKGIIQIDQLLDLVCKNTKNVEVAKILTEFIIDKNKNWYFTSHFKDAAAKGSVELCKYFIDRKVFVEYEKLSSYINEISAVNEELFILIIQNLSPETQELFFGCLEQAIQNKNKKLVDYLLKKGAFSNRALELAVTMNDLELVDIVLKYNSEPSFINKRFKDGTALTIAATKNNLLIFKRLLSLPGININLFGADNKNPLIEAIKKRNLEIFDTILDFYGENIHQQKYLINRLIHMLVVYNEQPTMLKANAYNTIGFNSKPNANQSNETVYFSPEKEKKLIDHVFNRLLDLKCVDINYFFGSNTLLTYACIYNNFTLVSNILEYENTDVNLSESNNGDTPLIICVKKKHFEIAKLLVDHPQINVNIQNFEQKTALTIATEENLSNFIELITSNERFDPKESRLNYSFLISKGETSKNLLSIKSLDVNYIDYELSTTPLVNAVVVDDIEKINMIINHPSFNKDKSQLKTAFKEIISNDKKELFIELIKVFCNDINTFEIDNRNLLDFTAINSAEDVMDEILKNTKFNAKKSDILKAFVDSYTVTLSPATVAQNQNNPMNNQNNFFGNQNNFMGNQNNFMGNQNNFIGIQNNFIGNQNNFMGNQNNFMGNQNRNNQNNAMQANLNDNESKSPIAIMDKLYEYDKEHDHLIDFHKLLPDGKSFYTSLIKYNDFNGDVTSFFLDHDVDPNKPDSNGILPLEAALISDSNDIAMQLINSGKVDFTQKIKMHYADEGDQSNPKYTTYLHLAARFADQETLEEILNKNVIDINATNDYGDTPLIEACRMKKKENIMSLFESDFSEVNQIDFLHKNNDGEDALHIADPFAYSTTITDKYEYLNKLLALFSKNENSSDDDEF